MKYIINTIIFIFLLAFDVKAQSDVVISEIFYNPPGIGDTLEFIELHNRSNSDISLLGYAFTKGISYTFPPTNLPANSHLVLARDATEFFNTFGVPALEWTDGALSNGGETILLVDFLGNFIDSVEFDNNAPWPTGPPDPNGDGTSIQLCDPFSDNNVPDNWSVATTPTGVFLNNEPVFATPGAACPTTDIQPPFPYNARATDFTTIKLQFNEPVNNTAELTSNYNINGGITTASMDATQTEVTLDLAVPLENGIYKTLTVSSIEDMEGNAMSTPASFPIVFNNTSNGLVITEIMYNSPGPNDELDFIEILNISNNSIRLGGLQMQSGVELIFPEAEIQPNGLYVICEDKTAFEDFFSFDVTQWTSGGLNNGGEHIALSNSDGLILDSLTYDDDLPWDTLADGNGYALELCDPLLDNSELQSWTLSNNLSGDLFGLDIFASPGIRNCGVVNIHSFDILNEIKIVPNPNSGIFTVEVTDNKFYTYNLFNSLGQRIQEGSFLKYKYFNFNNLDSGIYFLKLKDTTGSTAVKKIIIY